MWKNVKKNTGHSFEFAILCELMVTRVEDKIHFFFVLKVRRGKRLGDWFSIECAFMGNWTIITEFLVLVSFLD
ncbi:hypothetical protein ACJX0J_029560, partial [Zea mays]